MTKIWDYLVKLFGSVNRFKGLIRKFQGKTKISFMAQVGFKYRLCSQGLIRKFCGGSIGL